MGRGISRRGNGGARRRQQECNPIDQSFHVLPSRHQACGRSARVFCVCFVLWFLIWALSRFRMPSLNSTEWLPHQSLKRGVVLELFRYQRHPQGRNRSFTALDLVHRGVWEVSETSAFTQEEILVEEQPFDGQGFGDNLTCNFDSSRKRKGCNSDHGSMAYAQGASSSICAALGHLPLFGGERASEHDTESFFVEIVLAYGTDVKKCFMEIDTGSDAIWVNCKGGGPILVVGRNGLFNPSTESFLKVIISFLGRTFCGHNAWSLVSRHTGT